MCVVTESHPNDNIFTAYAFFAGASFTALFFVLQARSSFVLSDFVITWVAIASTLLFMATFGRLNIATGRIQRNTTYSRAVSWFAIVGVGFLFLSIFFVIFPFSIIAGIVILSILIFSITILNILANKELEKQKNKTQ